jgi:deoxyxylulose-5-phosphate synthase
MFIPHGKHSELLEYAGLSADQVAGRILKVLGRTET